MVSSTPRPHFTPGKDQVPILQEAGWGPGPVWKVGKSRPHRGFFFNKSYLLPYDFTFQFTIQFTHQFTPFSTSHDQAEWPHLYCLLLFTVCHPSSFPNLVLWKHFHCYLISVVAIYCCCVLYAAVSCPFSSALVIKMYLIPIFLSFANVRGGEGVCVLHCLQYLQIVTYCFPPLVLLIFLPS